VGLLRPRSHDKHGGPAALQIMMISAGERVAWRWQWNQWTREALKSLYGLLRITREILKQYVPVFGSLTGLSNALRYRGRHGRTIPASYAFASRAAGRCIIRARVA
jgi:hypothetical protein